MPLRHNQKSLKKKIDTLHHTYITSLWLTTGASRGGSPQRPILNKMLLDSLTAKFFNFEKIKNACEFHLFAYL